MGNLIGAGWMILAMALFAVLDSAIKLASETLPRFEILLFLGGFGALTFALASRANGRAALPRSLFTGAAALRSLFEAIASTLFVFALGAVPLSLFTSIVQVNPLLVTMGAALFLGEPVGWRRWLAIGVGLAGVLIVLRPTGSGFDASALLVLAGVIFQSARDVVTRKVSGNVHSLQLSTGAFLALFGTGLAIWAWQGGPFVMPGGQAWLYLACMCLVSIPAVFAMVSAMRIGDVGFVAPFRYSRILFGLALGVLVFQESLDMWTIIGSAIIIGSGLYAFWRETRIGSRASLLEPEAL